MRTIESFAVYSLVFLSDGFADGGLEGKSEGLSEAKTVGNEEGV